MEGYIKRNEAYLLLLAPLAGLALVFAFQSGRYGFYGVPFLLVQMDTLKLVLSALPLTIFLLAALSATGSVWGGQRTSKWIFLECLALSAFLTSPFWLGRARLDFAWISALSLYLVLSSAMMCAVIRLYKNFGSSKFQGKDALGKVSSISTVAFFALAFVLTSTYAYGYFQESDSKYRTYLLGTNYVVVDLGGDTIIVRAFDPELGKPTGSSVRIMKVSERGIEIERR